MSQGDITHTLEGIKPIHCGIFLLPMDIKLLMCMLSNLRQIPQLPAIKKSFLRNQHLQRKLGVRITHVVISLVILAACHSFFLQQCTVVYASACSLLCSQWVLSDSKLGAHTMTTFWLLSLSRAWQNITDMPVPLHLLAPWNLRRGWMEALTKGLALELCWPSTFSRPEKVLVMCYFCICGISFKDT